MNSLMFENWQIAWVVTLVVVVSLNYLIWFR